MSAFRFNAVLEAEGISPKDVSMILHTTSLQKLRRMLPYLAGERPDLFEAYNSVHSPQATATLINRPLAATFVHTGDRKLLFVGLGEVNSEECSVEEIYADPRFDELEYAFGATDTSPRRHIPTGGSQIKFTMAPIDALQDLCGRIQIAVPAGRAYVRIADNMDAEVVALSEENLLIPPANDWDNFIVSGPMLRSLPASWAARLREWRGIYLIVDESDGARYVGSAYGVDNLLGRWQAHVARDKGVTKELAKRDPVDFRFSILQLLAPDAEPDAVIAMEHSWMERLHTREHGLNA